VHECVVCGHDQFGDYGLVSAQLNWTGGWSNCFRSDNCLRRRTCTNTGSLLRNALDQSYIGGLGYFLQHHSGPRDRGINWIITKPNKIVCVHIVT